MKGRKYEDQMSNDERLAVLETTIININSTLLDIRQDIKDVWQDVKHLSDRMDNKFDMVNNRLLTNFMWLMGMIIGLAGLIAHASHWI